MVKCDKDGEVALTAQPPGAADFQTGPYFPWASPDLERKCLGAAASLALLETTQTTQPSEERVRNHSLWGLQLGKKGWPPRPRAGGSEATSWGEPLPLRLHRARDQLQCHAA